MINWLFTLLSQRVELSQGEDLEPGNYRLRVQYPPPPPSTKTLFFCVTETMVVYFACSVRILLIIANQPFCGRWCTGLVLSQVAETTDPLKVTDMTHLGCTTLLSHPTFLQSL